jgi:carbon monoxide dehydrogenase subunit G
VEIRESFHLDAPPTEVARILVDVPTVAGCVPGVEDVERLEDGSWSAVLAAQLGPIRARFAGTVALDDSAAPDRLSASGQGSDRGTGSQASVSMVATLTGSEAGGTDVDIVADVVIRGRLGQFGTGIIRATAKEMTKAFVECLRERMRHGEPSTTLAPAKGDEPAPGAAVGPGPDARPAPRPDGGADRPHVSPARIVVRGLVGWLRELGKRLTGSRKSAR